MRYLYPNWPAPKTISALTTTRMGGSSLVPFDTNNLGLHVGDNETNVLTNRKKLRENLDLMNEPFWLEQTHSTRCIKAEYDLDRKADAIVTQTPNTPLAIMTADCLPILLSNKEGTEIAAIHAGWRGLVNGIIENTLSMMNTPASQLIAWIGPAICQSCFEVGEEVILAYQTRYPSSSTSFKTQGEKWLANLPLLAEQVLNLSGVLNIFQSKICTFEQKNEFYSYRREQQTGRMVTLIWIREP